MESDAGKDGSRKRMYKKCYDVEKLKKICERRKVERRNSIFVRHISSNGHSWSKSIWIKRDAETWQTEKGE